MEDIVTLYFKELRNMKRELLIIFCIISGVSLYEYFFQNHIDFINPSRFDRFELYIVDHILYLFPLLFIYTLYNGKYQIIYQSVMYQKHKIVLSRFFVLIDALILTTLLMFIFVLLIMYNILPKPITVGAATAHDLRVVIPELIRLFSGPFICLSIICTAWGVMQTVKHLRFIIGTMVIIAGMLFYSNSMREVNRFGDTFFKSISYDLLFTIVLGSIFCVVGIYLIKRYSITDETGRVI
ncbi:hypothetical protein ACFL50_04030 [Candidatus Latescibacterota bacterium]